MMTKPDACWGDTGDVLVSTDDQGVDEMKRTQQ
jgi:hypothetical protein